MEDEPKKKRRKNRFDEARKEAFLALLRKGIRRWAACKKVNIGTTTFDNHMKEPEFAAEVLKAEMAANELVESALFKAAVGGNVTACFGWLYNRDPDRWQDRRKFGQFTENKPKTSAFHDAYMKRAEQVYGKDESP